MLANCRPHREIRDWLASPPHNLEYRQVREYITRAQEWGRERIAGKSREDLIAESVRFYESMIADETNDPRVRLEARKQLDLLFGLHAPKRIDHAGQVALVPSLSELTVEQARLMLESLKSAGGFELEPMPPRELA